MERHTEAESGSHFAALIEKRTGKRETFGVADVAAIYDVSSGTVCRWLEEGRLAGVDLNAGRKVPAGDGTLRQVRPYYRIERSAILALAARMEKGE